MKKLFALSPAIAPAPKSTPSSGQSSYVTIDPVHATSHWTSVVRVAATTPSTNPSTVLWVPSQRRLMGRFQPFQYRTNGGAMLATYAGAMK